MIFDIWVSVEKIQALFKTDKNDGRALCTKTCVHSWWYLAKSVLEWEMFQTKLVKEIKTHILWSITYLQKSSRLWDNVEKYGRAKQTTNDNVAHAHLHAG